MSGRSSLRGCIAKAWKGKPECEGRTYENYDRCEGRILPIGAKRRQSPCEHETDGGEHLHRHYYYAESRASANGSASARTAIIWALNSRASWPEAMNRGTSKVRRSIPNAHLRVDRKLERAMHAIITAAIRSDAQSRLRQNDT